jgi:hypothetical protein
VSAATLSGARCIETRSAEIGLRRRRYELKDGRRLSTVELPHSVLRSIGAKDVKKAMDTWHRGELQRARTARIDQLLQQGWKPLAIAHEVGVTPQAVRARRSRR